MSAGVSSGNGQDFELNLASIIDCFTVLIAFMLASASFLSIGILDAGVAAAGATPSTTTPPAVNVAIELEAGHKLVFKLSGKENNTTPLEAVNGAWNYEALSKHLEATKGKYSDVAAVTLTASSDIEYKDVIKTMEAIRKTIPVVMLGGF